MDGSNWPIVLIEGVMVLGGALAFGWWQLRSLERDRRETQRRRAAETPMQTPAETETETEATVRAGPATDESPAKPPPRPD